MQAFAEGKRVQFEDRDSQWQNLSRPGWDWGSWNYRIHPDDLNPPKLREWKTGEVPVGATLKNIEESQCRWLILNSISGGITTAGGSEGRTIPTKYFLENCLHSIDGGKTWHPCGVKE